MAAFIVRSAEAIDVNLPAGCVFPGGTYLLFRSPNSVAIGASVHWQVYDTATAVGSGGGFRFVASGGILQSGGGGNSVYIDDGGRYTNTGGGGNIFFVSSGGTFELAGGGGNAVYYEPGASVSNTSSGGNPLFIEVNSLAFSELVQVPEPSVYLILGIGGLGLTLSEAHHERGSEKE
jgi:hypothetical protein